MTNQKRQIRDNNGLETMLMMQKRYKLVLLVHKMIWYSIKNNTVSQTVCTRTTYSCREYVCRPYQEFGDFVKFENWKKIKGKKKNQRLIKFEHTSNKLLVLCYFYSYTMDVIKNITAHDINQLVVTIGELPNDSCG